MNLKSYSFSIFILLILLPLVGNSATYYCRANGNWTTASTWSLSSCSGTVAATTPGATDDVVICSGRTVTMNGNPANCLSLTVNGTANWTSTFVTNVGAGGLILNSGAVLSGSAVGMLNVAGATTQPSGATSTIGGITTTFSGTTTLSGTLTFNNTGGTKTFSNLIINAGAGFSSSVAETYTVLGNLTMNGGSLSGSSSGILNVVGSFIISTGATATMGNINVTVTGLTSINGTLTDNSTGGSNVFNNVNLNATGAFNNTSAETYAINGNLNTYGGDFLATGATPTFNIAGNFNVVSGVCDVSRIKFNISGTTTISGTLDINSVKGTKIFNDFIVTSTGTFNSTVAENYKVNGSIHVDGVFNANLGVWTLTGASKTISGTTSMVFDDITDNGSYTNSGSVRLTNSLKGSGTWTQAATGTVDLAITNANFSVNTFNASAVGNTVIYSRAGNQNVILPDDGSYSNLTVSAGSTKTLSSNTILNKNLLINVSTTLDANNKNMTIGGDFTNNNSFLAGTATVTLNGSAPQAISGSAITNYRNLTVNNSSGINLGINTSVSGVLNFTSGVITTSTNKVTIATGGSVTGAGTSKFVNGFLEKNLNTGASISRTYEIGFGATNYLPLTILFANVTTAGKITAKVNNGDQPNIATSAIDDLKSVNRYWSLTNSGTAFSTYSATCNFIGVPTDADAGSTPANYFMSIYNGSTWTFLTRGTVTSTSNQGLTIATMGDIAIGEKRVASVVISVSPSTTVCAGSTATFTAVPTYGGPTPSYQWQVNGSNVGTNSPTYATSTLTSGQIVTCIMTSSLTGVAGSPATSNSIVMTVTASLPVSVSVSASPSSNICSGTNVTFTATPTNGGATPTYQWRKNGVNIGGATASIFSSTTLINGDVITCVLTSSILCTTGNPATSSGITMVVNPILVASVSISASQSSPICSGTNVIFTATPTNGGTTPIYQWLLNGLNVGTNSTTYSNSTLVSGDAISCVLTSNAACVSTPTVTSNTISFTVTVTGTWLGSVSSNWNVASNWCGGVPVNTTNVIIQSGTSFSPQLTNSSVCKNITVNAGATLNMSSFSLNVKGNFVNNGTFVQGTGTLVFDGTVAQSVSTSSLISFNNLTINNASGVNLTSGVYSLDGALTCTSGIFNTNGNSFTMTSSLGKTARISPITGGSIVGNFAIQRFISARDTTYADLSSTVQSSTFNDWDNELPAISYVHSPPTAVASAFTYNEASDVYVPVTSSGTALTPGKGFEVFLAGDFSYASLPNTTMNAIGVPNQGTQNLSGLISNNAQGWNLVGNPFASNISWASVYTASGSAASGLYDFIEMYDYTIGDWNGYTSADAIEIGSAQGFWVYGLPGATALTLTIPELAKTTTSNSSIKTGSIVQPFFTLKISNNVNTFSHSFKVACSDDGKDGLDLKDLPFRASPNKATPALYSIVEGKAININTFNSADETYEMPLQTRVGVSGKYKIEAAGFDFVYQYTCIQLEDKLKHITINLREQNSYEFEMKTTDSPNRFVLHLGKSVDCKSSFPNIIVGGNLADNVEVFPTSEGSVVNFSFAETTSVTVEVMNVLGQTIVKPKTFVVSYSNEQIILPSDYSGMYIIKVQSEKGVVVKQFYKK